MGSMGGPRGFMTRAKGANHIHSNSKFVGGTTFKDYIERDWSRGHQEMLMQHSG